MASTDDQTTTTSTTEGAPSGAAEAAPAAPARRPRRATKKAAAPAPAAPPAEVAAGDAASAEGADAGAPAEAAAGEVTAKKAAKRAPRKSAKKAAKAPAAEPTEPAAEATEATEATEAPAPATKAAKRAPRKSAKKAAAVAEPVAEPVAPTAQEDEEEALAAARAEEARLAEGAAQPDTTSAATVPSFGVLFQAPDPEAVKPARKRATRKRATAPAQEVEPAAQPAAAPAEADHAPADDEAVEAAAPVETGESAEPAESGEGTGGRRRRRRGGKGRGRGRGSDSDARDEAQGAEEGGSDDAEQAEGNGPAEDSGEGEGSASSRRRRRRRRSGSATDGEDPPGTVTKVREPRRDEPQSVKGSTRLEAKKQRRREGREAGRRRTIITEAEFLARRESVDRVMVVRERDGKTQIGVLEDEVLVEHYVSRETNASMAGNVYLGRVQNVLPSMEAAFVDIGKGRNAVLYAGEVNWDAAGLENNQPKRIENALKSGDTVLVQVTKDPIGHKGARLTSQISLPGRYLVYVPEGSMTGISRKLPDTERARLKGILKEVVPDSAGVIVRTAAEGASEEELRADVERLTKTWEKIKAKADSKGKAKGGAPALVHGEPDLTVRVIRDVFNEDFGKLVVAGDRAWEEVSEYIGDVAPDLAERLEKWTGTEDLFTRYRVDEQIAKAMDRKVWLPSGGSLVIDRTEAMTVVDVNTGKFVGSGGNLEETVTKNNIEAAEEIVRQLRLRDIGGIIVIDFIDMVLESNRDLVVRRLLECLGRDRTKHQVAEVTSLGLVQMTRKRVGSGLIEVFSETCDHCGGRGIIVHDHPVEKSSGGDQGGSGGSRGSGAERSSSTNGSSRGRRGRSGSGSGSGSGSNAAPAEQQQPAHHGGPTPAQIAAAAHAAALKSSEAHPFGTGELADEAPAQDEPVVEVHETPDQEPVERASAAPETARHETAQPENAQRENVETETAQPEPARPAAAAAPTAAPRRRKRGRVVAPAGPPRPAASAADEAPAEPAPDAS
ncbi:Rne/Rng family ribonuclease [Phycicoccus sp. M110.8]|uniref:Rne/Rng family ribonuclease n=1 Tax=Phycicoccus sp. M110.8 TaxID=3075433 RepID=UPI0028FD250B|nr:Rne/Rng family ribonuclease [Phycicoccus sp. M110.8]MDU0314459.1 Rne/Rng family ribonuclease [Phycicoccus sp. M110.8]